MDALLRTSSFYLEDDGAQDKLYEHNAASRLVSCFMF